MAKDPTFTLNKKAIAELAKSAQAQAVVTSVASDVAAAIGGEAEVVEYTTDRAVAAVKIPAFDQAADGVLSRAAASAGIHITTQ